MGEVTLNLLFVLLALILTIIGAFVGAWLQQRSWSQQHWEAVREKRTKAALATVEQIARLIDRRLYRQRRLLWALSKSAEAAEIDSVRREYQAVLFEWMDNLGRIKAELWYSFGRRTAVSFEENIHDAFASIGSRIEANLRGIEPGKLVPEERQLNRLGYTSYQFIHSLLQRIADEDLVGLTGKDVVSFENWNNLSVSFLVKRLFGIPT